MRRMRSTKLAPFGEVWEKKLRRAIARECRWAALESLRFSRSGRRLWRARSTLSTQRVARTRARLLAVEAEAFAAVHAPAAEALGTLTRRTARAATTGAADLEKLMHYLSRPHAARPLRGRRAGPGRLFDPVLGTLSAGRVAGCHPQPSSTSTARSSTPTTTTPSPGTAPSARTRWCCRSGASTGTSAWAATSSSRRSEASGSRSEKGDDIRAAESVLYGELIGEVEPLEGARELIEDLKQRGHAVVLASSAKERRGRALPGPARRSRARRRLDHLRRRGGHEARARPGRSPRWRRPAAARP